MRRIATWLYWQGQNGDGWTGWSTYNASYCTDYNMSGLTYWGYKPNGAVWQYVGSLTCGYDPPSGTWGYFSGKYIWVWWLGYPGDYGNQIASMFC